MDHEANRQLRNQVIDLMRDFSPLWKISERAKGGYHAWPYGKWRPYALIETETIPELRAKLEAETDPYRNRLA